MFNFSLMGAGRIGKMHAGIIDAHPDCNLKYIYDINTEFVNQLANKFGANIASSPEQALTSKEIDAILIASAHFCKLTDWVLFAIINFNSLILVSNARMAVFIVFNFSV